MPARLGFSKGKSGQDDGVIVQGENGRNKRYICPGKEALGMDPDDNRPAGTQSATGVAQPTEAVMCAPHLTVSSRLRGEERSAKRQKASSGAALDSQNRPSAVSGLARNLKCQRHFNLEAANPGSPLGESTCTLPTKSESVIVGYYALKKRVSSGTLVRKTKREKEVRRWQETTERTGQA